MEEIRDVAKQFEINIVYGSIDRSAYNEKVDYNDCDFEEEGIEACGFIYENFHTTDRRRRFRITTQKFTSKNLEEAISSHFKNQLSNEPYYFSSDKKLDSISKESEIQVLSRNNANEILGNGKDSVILSYLVCGSNCTEKLKILTELIN